METINFFRKAWVAPAVASAVVLSLCVIALVLVMQLWRADLRIPLGGDFNQPIVVHDLYLELMAAKSVCDDGWILRNPYLGMPFGMQYYDVPAQQDNLDMGAIKLLSVFAHDPALLLNLYFLLTFPLTALTSLLVLRTFKMSYPSAVTASILFTFLPYHFLRGEGHINLAAYWPIPLAVMVMLWVWLQESDPAQGAAGAGWTRGQAAAAVMVAALLGSAFAYYFVFTCFLLWVAAIGGSVRTRSWRPLRLGFAFSGVILLSVVANVSPSLMYTWRHGANAQAVVRVANEAEIYSLKISRLLLPVTRHRLPFLAQLKDLYNRTTNSAHNVPNNVPGGANREPVDESDAQTLGAIAGLGFLYLLGSLLWTRKPRELVRALAMLTFSALLLGTVGGFGTIFNFVVTAQIRCYNRISIFIAFFSLFAVALLLDDLAPALERWLGRAGGRSLWHALLVLALILGLLDQTIPQFVPPYQKLKAEYLNDANFVAEVERSLPPGAMIFQLPYAPFPEAGWINRMGGWDLLKGYLHSKTLRWSFGTMTGRPEAGWGDQFDRESLPEAAEVLAFAGFKGIYIDRYGFKDNGAELESQLRQLSGNKPMVSRDNRLAFFNLTNFAESLRAKYTPEEWQAKRKAALSVEPATPLALSRPARRSAGRPVN